MITEVIRITECPIGEYLPTFKISYSLFIPAQILSTTVRFAIARSLWYTHIKSGMKWRHTYAAVY